MVSLFVRIPFIQLYFFDYNCHRPPHLFRPIPETDERIAIVDAFEPVDVGADSFIMIQGEAGDSFFVIETGFVDIYVQGASGVKHKIGNQLGPGSAFGELALLYNSPRAASIKSVSACKLWVIDRGTYRGIVMYYHYLCTKRHMDFLRNVEIMGRKLGVVMSDSK